jgi:uncharacterized protein with FMN-binding domain
VGIWRVFGDSAAQLNGCRSPAGEGRPCRSTGTRLASRRSAGVSGGSHGGQLEAHLAQLRLDDSLGGRIVALTITSDETKARSYRRSSEGASDRIANCQSLIADSRGQMVK